MRGLGGADIAAGARPIVDDHRLADRRRKPFGNHPGLRVGTPAGRERDNQPERMGGPVFGPGCAGDGGNDGECVKDANQLHGSVAITLARASSSFRALPLLRHHRYRKPFDPAQHVERHRTTDFVAGERAHQIVGAGDDVAVDADDDVARP